MRFEIEEISIDGTRRKIRLIEQYYDILRRAVGRKNIRKFKRSNFTAREGFFFLNDYIGSNELVSKNLELATRE